MNFQEQEVNISIEPRVVLKGSLCVPKDSRGVVLFAHGTGSTRNAPRNRRVAAVLRRQGLATLMLDLLTPEEERQDRWSHRLRFDIPLLGGRLILSTLWLRRQPDIFELPVGLFGASTGAAAALVAAAHEIDRIHAVVTRGGRIDLAGDDEIAEVRAPTLVIVGGSDVPVLAATCSTLPKLRCPKRLEIIPGAAHLFEQPGALDQVALLSAEWFERYLAPEPREPAQIPRASSPRASRPSKVGLSRH